MSCAVLEIYDPTQVGEARRHFCQLASSLGFNETELGRVAIVVTELASNIVKHALRGTLVATVTETSKQKSFAVWSIDTGPGMENISRCLEDGYSTAGSAGTGLGAIQRMATTLDLYSVPNKGTVLFAEIEKGESQPRYYDIAGINVPAPREVVSGDAWYSIENDKDLFLLVADGLGHGPAAARASEEAVVTFRHASFHSVSGSLEDIHFALKKTRGAAAALAYVSSSAGSVSYCGVGNISGSILYPQQFTQKSMASYNGTLGAEVRKFQEFCYEWNEDAVLVMHSDGLTSSCSLKDYPGLHLKKSAVIAGVLYRDFKRGRDDATVVVAKKNTGGAPWRTY